MDSSIVPPPVLPQVTTAPDPAAVGSTVVSSATVSPVAGVNQAPTQAMPPVQSTTDEVSAIAAAVPQAVTPTLNDSVVPSPPDVLATPVLEQMATQVASDPALQGGVSRSKEVGPASNELAGFVEVVGSDAIEKEPIPPEVASWMEKVNRGETGDQLHEVVVADSTANDPTGSYAQQPVFVLPLGELEYEAAKHKSVNDSIRWLAEWCGRIVKKLGGGVAYKSTGTN